MFIKSFPKPLYKIHTHKHTYSLLKLHRRRLVWLLVLCYGMRELNILTIIPFGYGYGCVHSFRLGSHGIKNVNFLLMGNIASHTKYTKSYLK